MNMNKIITYYSIITQILFMLMIITLPFVNKISKLFVVLFLISLFIYIKKMKVTLDILGTHKLFLYSLFGVVLLTNLVNNTVFINLKTDIYLFIYISIFYATVYSLKNNIISMTMILKVFLLSMIIYILYGLYISSSILVSVSKNQNIFAFILFLWLVSLTYIYTIFDKKMLYKFIIICLFIIGIYAILLTQCRQIWISTILFYVILIWLNRKNIKYHEWLLIIIAVISLYFTIILNSQMLHRMDALLSGSSSGRIEHWKIALNIISDSLIVGNSLQSPLGFLSVSSKPFVYNHNIIIDLLVAFGLIGIFFFVLFIKYFITIILKIEDTKIKYILFSSFLPIFFVQQQLGSSMLIHKLVGPFIMIYLAIIYYLYDKNDKNF
jgi:hypothetical protein